MNKSISILVVEDKALLAQDIADRLTHFGYTQIQGPYRSGEEALNAAKASPPDIALLDIHLDGKMNGITLAKHLNAIRKTPVIYLTQDQNNSVLDESLSTDPISYINKPFTNNELRMALHNAIGALENKMEKAALKPETADFTILNDRIFIRNGRGKIQVKLIDILWLQSAGGETSSVMTKESFAQKKRPYTIGLNLNKLEERLAFEQTFVRCSRFYILNLKEVERIVDSGEAGKSKKILVVNGVEIAVGEKYRRTVMERFHVL